MNHTLEHEIRRAMARETDGGAAPASAEESDLASWVNREFFDPLTGAYGRLAFEDVPPRTYRDTETRKMVTDPGGRRFYLTSAGGRTSVTPSSLLMDTATFRVLGIGGSVNSPSVATSKFASAADLERWGISTGGGGGAGGGGSGSFASSQAGAAWQAEQDRINREFQAEQERIDREFRAEQARIAAEEGRRQDLLGTATRLMEGRRQSRDTALQRAGEMAGQDIFRFLANVQQKQVPEGTMTPIDVFKAGNAQIATSQLPEITPNATIGDLESGIAKLTSMQQQEEQFKGGPFTGFAQGGMMGPNTMQQGTNKSAVLVGDKMMNGDEEVMVYDHGTGMAEVIPLGRAQTGASFTPDEWKATEQSLTVLPQLFQTLRSNVAGVQGAQPTNLGALGYLTPAQSAATGPATFGQRGALATPLSIRQGLIESTRYTPEQADQLANLIGTLPAPHKAAMFFRNLLPAEKSAIVSAYRLAGFPEADLDQIVSESIISGPARSGVSLR